MDELTKALTIKSVKSDVRLTFRLHQIRLGHILAHARSVCPCRSKMDSGHFGFGQFSQHCLMKTAQKSQLGTFEEYIGV